MRTVDRAVGFAGIIGMGLIVAYSIVAAPDARPGDSASSVTAALTSNRDSARIAAYLGIVGAFLFGTFVARLYGALRAGTTADTWVPVTSLIGGCALIAAAVVEIGSAFAASEFRSSGDTSLGAFFVLWWWSSANIYAAGFALLVVGGTAASAPGEILPAWFRWFSWAMWSLIALLVLVIRAPGLGAGPGLLWVAIASILLALRPGHQRSPDLAFA